MMLIMRDSGNAVTMTPRWNATPSTGRRVLHSRGKEETDHRVKRPKRLYDLSLFRIWFSGGYCRYRGLAQPVDSDLERNDDPFKFGGASDHLE